MARSSTSAMSSLFQNSSGRTMIQSSSLTSVARDMHITVVDRCEYWLHKAKLGGELRLVKVFGGPSKREHFKKSLHYAKQSIHPNIAALESYSNPIDDASWPDLYFVYSELDLDVPCDLLEVTIAKELRTGLIDGIIVAMKAVVGFAQAVDFLRREKFPLARADIKHFDIVSGHDKCLLFVIHPEYLDAGSTELSMFKKVNTVLYIRFFGIFLELKTEP
ncbi:hypothetical protein BDQ17DRAFT_1320989 [Cyathus striatus]|nr:hypothetical protein BDQ17DRAFT_1320989 [Cyathus striatus]